MAVLFPGGEDISGGSFKRAGEDIPGAVLSERVRIFRGQFSAWGGEDVSGTVPGRRG